MAITWELAALILAALFVVLLLAHARRTERRAWPAWEATLAGESARAYEAARDEIRVRLFAVDQGLLLARAEHAGGGPNGARLLRRATHAAMRLVRRLDAWLQAWRDRACTLAAIRPVAPLSMRMLRSRVLRGLAWVDRGAYVFALTSRRRFLVRVFVLRRGLGWIRRVFGAIASDARSGTFDHVAARAETARADLGALGNACTATLHSLASSSPRDA